MKNLKNLISFFVIFTFLLAALYAVDDPRAREIVSKVDELYRSTSSYGLFEMEIITPHWKRKLKIKSWSLGKDKTFMRILEPKKERGMATLKINREMWNFLPKTNKIMKIPPSMMMGSWMGSDFTNDDLVKEYTYLEDYSFEIVKPEGNDSSNTYVKCIPKEGLPIIWGHVIIAVKEKGYIPVFQKYYDEKGNLMREMYFKDIKRFGKREIPSVMELIPTKKKGKRTIIRYLEAEFGTRIDKKIFTLRNLRKRI
ncbi:MAG: outer membrane lipoprotein-sorting protein [Acidobacteriota bacterium]